MKAPLIYKGFIIKKDKDNGKLYAFNFNDVEIQPIFESWKSLKLVIDNLK